jgi:hypothetical protein
VIRNTCCKILRGNCYRPGQFGEITEDVVIFGLIKEVLRVQTGLNLPSLNSVMESSEFSNGI